MNIRTKIHLFLLSLLSVSFFCPTAMAEKPVEASSCNISGSFSQDAAISHLTVGIDSLDGVSKDVTLKDSSREYGHFASSKGNNYLNGSEDDDGNAPQICKTGKTIGEYVPNEADYSLEMTYDDMYRVIGKSLHLSQSGVQFDGTLSSGYDLSYTYDQDTGKRFQMSTVNDVNYRTDSVYTLDDNVIESHNYEYDKNGNIIHALTAETRADGTTVNLTREEKFRWDEENRLLAITQNGYVSHYWYDADGERVVKEHGANQAVFVNSEEDGTVTQTDKYSVYPNGYYSYGDDGRYTKHIYIGAERIASQVGGKPYPSPNTESVSVAGRSNGIDIRVDYTGKLDQHLAQIDSVYDAFDLPYNGTNHDSYYNNYFFDRPGYWDNTEGMTLNGGEPEMPRSIQDRDLLYYYHRDHLGSSTAVSNDDGKLSQQIEYLPYGEVFLEKQMASNDYHSPYKFNGKELDEETGLYYYGARYYNPRQSIWYATDQLELVCPNTSTYTYCKSNPITLRDPTGNGWIEQNHRYFYDPQVTNQDKAKELYGNTAIYLFESGQLYATNYSYSYNLENGGHVRNTYTDEIVTGEFTTKGGSTIVNDNLYFSQKKLSLMERWSSSDNFFAQLSYETLNDFYVGLQVISLGAFEREEWKNPFTGACFGNLDGTPNYNQIDAIPGLATELLPISSAAPQGIKLLNKLNAADFSKTFKGNLSRLKPKTRGHVNRAINSKIDKANQYIGSGKIVLDGTSLVKKDEHQ